MLANDPAAEEFGRGTVYQAYLNPYNYHRWHSPVSGTILSTKIVEGTYYSETECEGEDPAGPNNSQGYITHVAARAIIQIMADDPAIGRMALIPVGMAEVSSCVVNPGIVPGTQVKKGEELGYFQFGGSTHCLIFRANTIKAFAQRALPDHTNPDPPLMLVNSFLATALR